MTIRDYICPECFLIWRGEFDTQREACPHCGHPDPEATDTFACAYWERNLGQFFGPDVCRDNYWTMPDRMPPHDDQAWAKRHEPNPNRPNVSAAVEALWNAQDTPEVRRYHQSRIAERADYVRTCESHGMVPRNDQIPPVEPDFDVWLAARRKV